MSIIYSPIEQFEVAPLIIITGPLLGDIVFALTNFVIYGIVISTVVIGLHTVADNNHRLVPSHWSVLVETVYASVGSFSADQLGIKNITYFPFIYAIFWTLLISNLAGNIPYGFAITGSAIISIGLSFVIFISVTIIGLKIHKVAFFSYFIPSGTPLALVPLLTLIELVSYFARSVSLGVRLAANIIAGHMLLAILASFLYGLFTSGLLIASVTLVPFAIFVALIVLEIAVSIIQAYVFCTLVASYIHDAIELH